MYIFSNTFSVYVSLNFSYFSDIFKWYFIRIQDNFVFFLVLRLLCLQTVEIQHGSHLMVKIVMNLLMETGMLQNIFVLALMGKTRSTNVSIFSLLVTTSIYPVPSVCSQDHISDWFASLDKSLHWNLRTMQKAMDEL